MMKTVRGWQLLVGCAATGAAAVLGFSGAVATAEPVFPSPPTPGYGPGYPSVVTQTVTVTPNAAGVVPSTPGALTGLPAAPAAAPAVPAPVGAPAVPAPVGALGPSGAPAVPSTLVPATSGTLREYFAAKGVQLEPQQPTGFTALNITLPVPPNWTQVPDPNVPDAFAVIADRRSGALYTPNAQVVVYRLVGDFDPKEAITHGFIENQRLFAWQTTNASLADFEGFPSSVIEGTYRDSDLTLNTSQRHVIVPAGTNTYLVSLTVTTGISESVGHGPATDAIVNGFRVAVPAAAPASAPAVAGQQ